MMPLFRRSPVKTKIIAGYLLVLCLMAVVGGGIILRVGRIGGTVDDLTDHMAAEQHAADAVVSQIWMVRFFARRYMETQSAEDLERFNAELARFETLLAETEAIIGLIHGSPKLARIREGIDRYRDGFYNVADLINEQAIIATSVLDLQGALLEIRLATLADALNRLGDAEALYRTCQLQTTYLRIRLNGFRYAATGEERWLNEARYREAAAGFNRLRAVLSDPDHIALTASAESALQTFIRGMDRIREGHRRHRAILKNQLNVEGGLIERTGFAMSQEVAREFREAKESAQALLRRSRQTFSVATMLFILLGAVLGLAISRTITRPISAMMGVVRRITDGDFSRRVPVMTEDEIGHLGRAFNGMTDTVVARTEELEKTVEALQNRKQELAAANNELKEFAYVVSHDLKAPLRGISQLAEWLREDYGETLDTEGREIVSMMRNRVRRMDGLIDGILQYSRVGRVRETPARIDLNELVSEVVDFLGPPDDIRISVEDRLPTVVGEPTRLAQVFQNLVGNAVKFMDKPRGKVRIGCVDRGTVWEFSVADNGPGIDEKYHDKIFQIFQTLTSRDEVESTGIGLTLVKKIVELYGGEIRVTSRPGEGTTFVFTLPRAGDESTPDLERAGGDDGGEWGRDEDGPAHPPGGG